MPLWQWVLDSFGALLAVVVLYALLLVVRRRWISRRGGTFECSHRVPRHQRAADRPVGGAEGGDRPTGGRRQRSRWMLGTGRYTEDSLEWFRVFSLAPGPKRRWPRDDLEFVGRREPSGLERHQLYPGHVVARCTAGADEVDLALSPASMTGLQSWLEARRPGTDWSR